MARTLTDKQLKYIELRGKGYTPTKSIMEAYKPKNKLVASVMGNRLEKLDKIKLAINEDMLKNFTKEGISESFVLQGLKEIAINGRQESNRVRSYELLGKSLKLWIDTPEVNTGTMVIIDRQALTNTPKPSQPIDTTKDITNVST